MLIGDEPPTQLNIDCHPPEGWGYLTHSQKWHYFTEAGRSLCGKWFAIVTTLEVGNDENPDNCAACKRKLRNRK